MQRPLSPTSGPESLQVHRGGGGALPLRLGPQPPPQPAPGPGGDRRSLDRRTRPPGSNSHSAEYGKIPGDIVRCGPVRKVTKVGASPITSFHGGRPAERGGPARGRPRSAYPIKRCTRPPRGGSARPGDGGECGNSLQLSATFPFEGLPIQVDHPRRADTSSVGGAWEARNAVDISVIY